jgi:hypothetical protein
MTLRGSLSSRRACSPHVPQALNGVASSPNDGAHARNIRAPPARLRSVRSRAGGHAMSTRFGEHAASDVVTQANTFVTHIEDPDIWRSMHDPVRGRMKPADVTQGRTLLTAARAALAESENRKGDTLEPTHTLDVAESAAHDWLVDQLTHARGLLRLRADATSRDALSASQVHSEARDSVAKNIRAFIALAGRDDNVGHAVSASYPDHRVRDAIFRDGEHLAAAVEAAVGQPASAVGDRHAATVAKDDAVDQLARWLHRWSDVARRVIDGAGQQKLGIAHGRHHPAHRPHHPAAAPPTAAPAATPSST